MKSVVTASAYAALWNICTFVKGSTNYTFQSVVTTFLFLQCSEYILISSTFIGERTTSSNFKFADAVPAQLGPLHSTAHSSIKTYSLEQRGVSGLPTSPAGLQPPAGLQQVPAGINAPPHPAPPASLRPPSRRHERLLSWRRLLSRPPLPPANGRGVAWRGVAECSRDVR